LLAGEEGKILPSSSKRQVGEREREVVASKGAGGSADLGRAGRLAGGGGAEGQGRRRRGT